MMNTLYNEVAELRLRDCGSTKSKLCIQEELKQQRNNYSRANLHYKDATDTDSCEINNSDSVLSDTEDIGAASCSHFQKPPKWRQGFFGRIKHVVKTSVNDIKHPKQDDTETYNLREIPHESLSELEKVTEGASADVYRGIFEGGIVAIKHVRQQMRFNMEMDLKHIRKLNHENIVNFKGVCTTGCCTIMEYCKYGSLYDCLTNIKAITPPRVLEWALQIASGMQYLHANKIIHRDLKSPNILVSDKGILKICDFGTSKEWNDTSEDATKDRSFTGTPAWMAPEMVKERPYNEKVDVWSYGVVVWELLTCKRPYEGAESFRIMYGVGQNNLCLPIPSTCPEEFKHLIELCMRNDPEGRPSFARILLHLKNTTGELLSQPKDNDNIEEQKCWKKEIQLRMQNMKFRICKQYRRIINPLQDIHKRRKAPGTQSTTTTPEIDTSASHDAVDTELYDALDD